MSRPAITKASLFKTRPYTEYLAEKYGGKWTYDLGSGAWECDDGERYVDVRVSIDEDNHTRYKYLYYKTLNKPVELA
jgi:hypothetical protein